MTAWLMFMWGRRCWNTADVLTSPVWWNPNFFCKNATADWVGWLPQSITFHLQEVSRLILWKSSSSVKGDCVCGTLLYNSAPSLPALCISSGNTDLPLGVEFLLRSGRHAKQNTRSLYLVTLSLVPWAGVGWAVGHGLVENGDEGGRSLAQHPVKIGLVVPAEARKQPVSSRLSFIPARTDTAGPAPPITSRSSALVAPCWRGSITSWSHFPPLSF